MIQFELLSVLDFEGWKSDGKKRAVSCESKID